MRRRGRASQIAHPAAAMAVETSEHACDNCHNNPLAARRKGPDVAALSLAIRRDGALIGPAHGRATTDLIPGAPRLGEDTQ